MTEEWRIVQKTESSVLRQLWVRLRSGPWAPTERFMLDAQSMPVIQGGSPGTVDEQVAAGGDDGSSYTGSAGFSATGTIAHIGYRDIEQVYIARIFARWDGVTIGGTIDVAYIELYAHEAGTGSPQMKVYGVDEDNPTAPTSAAEFDADPLTDAAIDWDDAFTIDTWEQSPSLNAIFQELVDIYTISNEAVMVQVKDDLGSGNNYNRPRMYEWSNHLYGPKLHIEFTPARRVFITHQ